MNIDTIYERYAIPLNLQKHMLRVAAVGKIIVDGFKLPLAGEMLVQTLLLHDMGNIIKFKLDNPTMLEPEDQGRVDELRERQAEFVAKYGSDCDEATLKIIAEITDDPQIVELCANSHGSEAHLFLLTDEWEKKISYYCDMRVGPFGVISVDQRFDDLEKRYAGNDHAELLRLRRYRNECLLIQEQIQHNFNDDLEDIQDEMVNRVIDKLRTWEI